MINNNAKYSQFSSRSFQELPENRSHQDVMIIQNRVKNCLRYANIRKGLISDLPPATMSQQQDVEKESQATVSIFESKSVKKLGKYTRQLVSLSMETFKPVSTHKIDSTNGFNTRAPASTQGSPSLLKVAPSRYLLPSLTSKFISTEEWMTQQDDPASDGDE